MFTLVIGGAASGKSEYAELHVTRLTGRRIYLAAMRPWDQECLGRIARHRLLRRRPPLRGPGCHRLQPSLLQMRRQSLSQLTNSLHPLTSFPRSPTQGAPPFSYLSAKSPHR